MMVTSDNFMQKLEGFVKDVLGAAANVYTAEWTPATGEDSTIRAMILRVEDGAGSEELSFATMDGAASDIIMGSHALKNYFVNMVQEELDAGKTDAVILVDEAWEATISDAEYRAADEHISPKEHPNRTQVILAAVYTAHGGFHLWKQPIGAGMALGPVVLQSRGTGSQGSLVPDVLLTAQPMQ